LTWLLELAGLLSFVDEDTMPARFGDSVNLQTAKVVPEEEFAGVTFDAVGIRILFSLGAP
jgi:hypothetical protein